MIRKKPAPHLMRGVKRFSEKIMPKTMTRQEKGRFPDSTSAEKLSKLGAWSGKVGTGFPTKTMGK
jgi:hypothetical protein